jgi:hypothetical protein
VTAEQTIPGLTNEEDTFYRLFKCPSCGGDRIRTFSGSMALHLLRAQQPCFCDSRTPPTAASQGDKP